MHYVTLSKMSFVTYEGDILFYCKEKNKKADTMAIVITPFRLTGVPVEVVAAGVVAAAVVSVAGGAVTGGAVGYPVLQPSLLQHFMSQLFMNTPSRSDLAFIISLRTRQPVEGVGQ